MSITLSESISFEKYRQVRGVLCLLISLFIFRIIPDYEYDIIYRTEKMTKYRFCKIKPQETSDIYWMKDIRYIELLCVIDKNHFFEKRVLQSEKSCSILQATKQIENFFDFQISLSIRFFEAVRFDFRKKN